MQAVSMSNAVCRQGRIAQPRRASSRVITAQKLNQDVPKKANNAINWKACGAGMAAGLLLALSAPNMAQAKLDTSTFKTKPGGAMIEYSDIGDESSAEVVRKLQEEILPKVQSVLKQADSGVKPYTASVVQELRVVAGEIEALAKQQADGGNSSNVKSLASSIEQQINALKATVGFD